MKQVIFIVAACLVSFAGYAQEISVEAKKLSAYDPVPAVERLFEDYAVFETDVAGLASQLSGKPQFIHTFFNFEGFRNLETNLTFNPVLAEDYETVVQVATGAVKQKDFPAIFTYQGKIKGQPSSHVALTVAEGMISGCFRLEDGNTYYFEPLRQFDSNAGANQFVLYNNSDILESDSGYRCGATEAREYQQNHITVTEPEGKGPQKPCVPKKLRIALASDYRMVQHYGSVQAVLAHNVAVINLVQTNFDDEFQNPIRLQIVAQYVSQCPECDPWSNTTNFQELATEFADWVNSGGFGTAVVDWANLRTRRGSSFIFQSYTFQGGLCGYYRVGVLREFGELMCQFQKQTAHELGHGIGATTTASGIMSESPICIDFWEQASVDQINAAIQLAPCLTTCTAYPPMSPIYCLYTPTYCHTFNAPCVAGYIVSTNNPDWIVSSSGTTICLDVQNAEELGEWQVYVSAVDHCGNYSDLSIAWTINTACRFSPDPEERSGGADAANNVTVVQTNDALIIQDAALRPGLKFIRLFDLNGRLILEKQNGDALIEIPLDFLPAGMFIVHVQAADQTVVKKVNRY